MESREILKYLPHRYPFLMVDRILEVEPGVRTVGIKNITANEPQFAGHWPENPVMPGVLMLEAMAQVGGIFLLAGPEREGQTTFFAALDGVRFRRQVIPGDQLVITADVIRRKGNMWKVSVVARVDDEVAVEGEFMFALVAAGEQD